MTHLQIDLESWTWLIGLGSLERLIGVATEHLKTLGFLVVAIVAVAALV
jgi:hypothetical protein